MTSAKHWESSKVSTAYHPQTDGETGCVNQELEQYLCTMASSGKSWVELLPFTEFAHNSKTHATTCKTPFKIPSPFASSYLSQH